MACIRKRRNKWMVDYRDALGIRRWVTCGSKREAELILSEKLKEARRQVLPGFNPDVTLRDYSIQWLHVTAASVKPRTLESYEETLRLHLLPVFGNQQLRKLQRAQIKAFLAEKLHEGYSRNSVRIMLATLRGLLAAAIEDGILFNNPAEKLGRQLRLKALPQARQERIKALDRAQLEAFLSASWKEEPVFYPLFLTLARTGMRIGEALALKWEDIDFSAREIRVERTLSAGRIDTPKSGHGRTIDMSRRLQGELLALFDERMREASKRGWREMPEWVFCTSVGTQLDRNNAAKAFKRVLEAAGLSKHFSLHSLRHSYASLLLQQGESPVYVQRQLGHSSIQLTVDTYGKWLPMGNKAAVDRLDDKSGSKVVAISGRMRPGAAQVVEISGAPAGKRFEQGWGGWSTPLFPQPLFLVV